ncbi:MAG TPA: hypothetical protein VFB29_12595 [Pseudolabrys sp.]|nr:hypothetical protein [Pseudolabrys sp.]
MRVQFATGFRLMIAALMLGGCTISGGTQSGLTGAETKPGVILVSDFVFSSDVVAVDRGYTARLERKIGAYPAHERRQRTAERVNDEIVATIIATLREAGLEAQAGGEDTLTLDRTALVVSGTVRPAEPVTAKNRNSFGFGPGRDHVVAAMTASLFSAGGKRQVLTFDAEPAKSEPAQPPRAAAARHAAIAAIVASAGGPNERLSPDVEGPARRLGRAIADRVLGFARQQGWLAAPGQGTATTPAREGQPEAAETGSVRPET